MPNGPINGWPSFPIISGEANIGQINYLVSCGFRYFSYVWSYNVCIRIILYHITTILLVEPWLRYRRIARRFTIGHHTSVSTTKSREEGLIRESSFLRFARYENHHHTLTITITTTTTNRILEIYIGI